MRHHRGSQLQTTTMDILHECIYKYHALVFVILVHKSYLTPNQKVGSEIVMKYTNVYEEEKTRRRKNLAYNV